MSTKPEQVQSVEETLEKTDFGHVINENKKPILIVSGLVVVLIIAYAIFDHIKSSENQETLDQIFQVESQVFTPYLEDKAQTSQFMSSVEGIKSEYIGHPNLTPSFLLSLNKAQEKNEVDAKLIELADKWLKKIDQRSELYLLSGLRIAALYEDQGQPEKALKLMQDIEGKNFSILSDRVNFELGRLHLKTGDNAKAGVYLQKVIDYKGESELKNMAKIYLSEL